MRQHLAPAFRSLRHWAVVAAFGVAATVTVLGLYGSPAAAAGKPRANAASASTARPPTLTLSVAPGQGKSVNLTLTAYLKGGPSNSSGSVAFFVVDPEFSQGVDVAIGTARAATGGAASISYQPTWSGKEQFVAKVTSGLDGDTPSATAYYSVAASSPGPLYATANLTRPASSLGHVFVGTLLVIVALVWLTLISTLLLVARRLPRLAVGGLEEPASQAQTRSVFAPEVRAATRDLLGAGTAGGTRAEPPSLPNGISARTPRAEAAPVPWAASTRGPETVKTLAGRLGISKRTILVALGAFWILDGILQFQPKMFGIDFYTMIFQPAAQGQPAPLASLINDVSKFLMLPNAKLTSVAGVWKVWNFLFASLQVLIGVGLFFRKTVRPAIVTMVVWSFLVWVLSEGMGMIPTWTASALTGAPGSVTIYALLGLMVWPTEKKEGTATGIESAGVASGPFGPLFPVLTWATLWGLFAVLFLIPANRGSSAINAAIAGAAPGEPGWYAHFLDWVAKGFTTSGTEWAWVLAAASLVIGLGPLLSRRPTIFLAAGALLEIAFWVTGQALGGVLTGVGTDPNTGPLMVVLAIALAPTAVLAAGRAPAPVVKLTKVHPLAIGGATAAVVAAVVLSATYPIPPSTTTPAISPSTSAHTSSSDGGASTPTTVPPNMDMPGMSNMDMPGMSNKS